jgi:hypothetical protein
MGYTWYSLLLDVEPNPRPQCGRKDLVNKKIPMAPSESNLQPNASTDCATTTGTIMFKETIVSICRVKLFRKQRFTPYRQL